MKLKAAMNANVNCGNIQVKKKASFSNCFWLYYTTDAYKKVIVDTKK
jgi:phosphomevalonate kinase